MASQEIMKTLEYIQERSSNIRRLSEKLERELWRLQRVFDSDIAVEYAFNLRTTYIQIT